MTEHIHHVSGLTEATSVHAICVQCDGDELLVASGEALYTCRRAAGCLLLPEPGDLVLASLPTGNGNAKTYATGYVLAVLERAPSTAESPAQVHLGAHVLLQADESLQVEGGQRLGVSAVSTHVTTDRARMRARRVSLVASVVENTLGTIATVAKGVETTCRTLTQRLHERFSFVEDLDETQAGTSRTVVQDTCHLHGRIVHATASEIVKVDGEEVHLG